MSPAKSAKKIKFSDQIEPDNEFYNYEKARLNREVEKMKQINYKQNTTESLIHSRMHTEDALSFKVMETPKKMSRVSVQNDVTPTPAKIDKRYVDPKKTVLAERELMKFKPGMTMNYLSRWVQLTEDVFRYYRNYYHSVSSFSKPLIAIPFSHV